MDTLKEAMKGKTVLVIGDIMLDHFIYGEVDRISPEGPVPVLRIKSRKTMLGGAGNVLANLSGLGVKAALVSLIGQDADGQQVRERAAAMGADIQGLIVDAARPTTVKTRYIARSQQLLRTDAEETGALDSAGQAQFLAAALTALKYCDAVILSDYGKGALQPELIREVIAAAAKNVLPVLVDPKVPDYSVYAGASVITPNKKELSLASGGMPVSTDIEVVEAARKIMATANITCVVATRSEAGLSVIGKGREPVHIKAAAREVYDVSGAGDTVIAVLAAALAAGAEVEQAAALANRAGGIVVGKMGTAAITAAELFAASSQSSARIAPLLDWEGARAQVDEWKAQGLKVGFTNGCFDIVHKGHVGYLDQARGKCDRLVLGLNHDASVRILKGPTRPVNDEGARAAVMGALSSVDLVVFFGAEKSGEDNTPCALIGQIRPDIFFKGGDYTIDKLPEAKVVHAYGGEVEIMAVFEGYSTTNIIEKSKSGKAA